MEDDDDDYYNVQRTSTESKLEVVLQKQKELFEKQKENENKPKKSKTLMKQEKELIRQSISISKPTIDKLKFEKKITSIINDYLKNHQMKQFEKIPDYIEKKEDDSLLIKQCDLFNKNDSDYLPLIIIDDKFYEDILSFIDKYIKYNRYNFILTLKNKLIKPMNKIQNYNIFHKEKIDESEYNSFIAETISSSIIKIYDDNEIKVIKNDIQIAAKEFKDDFNKCIQEWVTTVYDIISDYIIFNLRERPLYYFCDKCKMPIIYKENNISEDNISINNKEKINNNKNIINNENENVIHENVEPKLNNDININKEKVLQKRLEKKKIQEKNFIDKIKNDENEGRKYKSLINIANVIFDFFNYNLSFEIGNEENTIKNTANPPKKSNNTQNEKNEKNLIYYDENKHTNYDLFEREISGAFVFVSEQKFLEAVMEYLDSISKIKNFIFIINGKNCEKIFEYLNSHNYLSMFESCCLITTNKKYDDLSNKYSKPINIFKTKKELIQYIRNYKNIELVDSTKLVTFKKYSDTYYKFHQKIASFYGNLNHNLYESSFSLFKDFLNDPGNTDPKSLVESFKLFQQIEQNKKGIVQLYTNKNAYYPVFNKWLYQLDFIAYEKTSYFLSGIMYSLDLFGDKQKNKTLKKKIYRGMRLNLINLLPYKNNVGKIIVFPSFTSTTMNQVVCETFSGRIDDTDELVKARKSEKIFSVIFYISFDLKSNWIPNGIDVQDISCYSEEEILFQPFTFFKITKVDINFDKNIADIDLEVIGRKEILENKIKDNKMIIYNMKEGIMEIVE